MISGLLLVGAQVTRGYFLEHKEGEGEGEEEKEVCILKI